MPSTLPYPRPWYVILWRATPATPPTRRAAGHAVGCDGDTRQPRASAGRRQRKHSTGYRGSGGTIRTPRLLPSRHAAPRFPGPDKILMLADKAFAGKYDRETILRWLRTFYRRFFSQQFKRSCMPDGVKVGSICLSPRGDWRMPSDATVSLWLKQLDKGVSK